MKRRSFLLASGSTILSGTAISGLQRPAFGLEFELLTTPSTDPSNVNSVLVDFDNFRLTPQYVDSSKDATITIEVTIGSYSQSVSKTVSVTNGKAIKSDDLNPETPVVVDGIDTTKNAIDGEIVITVEHSSIGTETYQQGFTITENPLVNGLVAYYPMEESGSTVLHDGALTNLGQVYCSWNGSGQVGSDALTFDGVDDYVSFDSQIVPDDTRKPFTISVWVKVASSKSGFVVGQRDNGDDGDFEGSRLFLQDSSSGDSGYLFEDSSNNRLTLTFTGPSSGVWTHIAVTYDGSQDANNVRVYVDGTSRSTSVGNNDSISPTMGCPDNTTLGARDADSPGNYFEGELDDVRIYDRVLSKSEIQTIQNRTFPSGSEISENDVPSQSEGGVSRYEFESDVTDSWGSNDGTDNTSAGFVNGVYGQSKDFDGSDDYIFLESPSSLTNLPENDFTFTTWAKCTVTTGGNWNTIFSTYDGPGNSAGWNFRIFIDSNDDPLLRFDAIHDTQRAQSRTTTIPSIINNWNHYSVVWNQSTLTGTLYINGVEPSYDTKQSASGSYYGDSGLSKQLGRLQSDSSGQEFQGQIDDVRIYDRALSESEVKDLFSLGSYRI